METQSVCRVSIKFLHQEICEIAVFYAAIEILCWLYGFLTKSNTSFIISGEVLFFDLKNPAVDYLLYQVLFYQYISGYQLYYLDYFTNNSSNVRSS